MQYVVAAMLSVYFLFFLEHVFSTEFYRKVGDLTSLDWFAVAFIPVLLIVSAFIARHYKHSRLNSREVFWVSIVTATMIVPILLRFMSSESSIAIVLSAYFASIGWLYTNHVAQKNFRKSHTMTVLMQLRNSAEYHKHRLNVFTRFPMGSAMTDADLSHLKRIRSDPRSYTTLKFPIIESMTFILNYFEFISTGVRTEDLDANMIELSMRSIFINWHDHLWPFIDSSQKKNPKAFVNFTDLVKQYKTRSVPAAPSTPPVLPALPAPDMAK